MLKLRSNKLLFRSLCVFMAFVMAFPAFATGLPAAVHDFGILIRRLGGDLPNPYSTPPRERPRRANEVRDKDRSKWWSADARQAYEIAQHVAYRDQHGLASRLIASTMPMLATVAWGSGSTAGYPIPGEGSYPGGGSGKANKLGLTGTVNSATSNLTLSWPIVGFKTRGDLSVGLTLVHNSQSQASGDFGAGWTHSYSMNVTSAGGYAFVEMPDGLVVPYTISSPGVYDPPVGWHAKLEDTLTSYKLTMRDQTVYEFTDYTGLHLLTSVADRRGNTVAVTRTGGGQLASVDAPDGRQLEFFYNGSGWVDHIDGPGGKTWSFTYLGKELESGTFPQPSGKNRVETFVYDGDNNITEEVDPNGESWLWTYQNTDDIASWTDPGASSPGQANFTTTTGSMRMDYPGSGYYYHYYSGGLLWLDIDADAYYTEYAIYDSAVNRPTDVYDKRGKHWEYVYAAPGTNGEGQVLDKYTPLGNHTVYTYTAFHDIDVVTGPVTGEFVDYDYDSYGRLELVTQSRDGINPTREPIELGYGGTYDQLIWTKDALKRQTDYDINGKGELEEVDPPTGADRFFA